MRSTHFVIVPPAADEPLLAHAATEPALLIPSPTSATLTVTSSLKQQSNYR